MTKTVMAIKKPAKGASSFAGLSALRSTAWVMQGGFVVLAIAFVALTLFVRTAPYFAFDLAVSRAVQSFNPPWFDLLMRLLSLTGFRPQVFVWVALAILALFVSGYRREAIAMFFSAAGIGAIGYVAKFLVDRPRPSSDLVHVTRVLDSGMDSFPAGHVLINVVIMGFLIYLALTLFKPSWRRVMLVMFLGSQVALIGLARIYEGEHWLTDVIGGYLLGSLWLIVTIGLYEWGKARFMVKTKSSG